MREEESRVRRCGVLGHRGERGERRLPLYEGVARTGASKQGHGARQRVSLQGRVASARDQSREDTWGD